MPYVPQASMPLRDIIDENRPRRITKDCSNESLREKQFKERISELKTIIKRRNLIYEHKINC